MAAEANLSLLRQHAAVILARQAAQRIVKRLIQREGRVKLSTLRTPPSPDLRMNTSAHPRATGRSRRIGEGTLVPTAPC